MTGTAERSVATSAATFAEPSTLPELFRRAVAEFDLPNALNYKAGGEWRPISSREFLERAERAALGLRSLGLAKGDRAAILSRNCPEWTIADAGCQLAG
ncbi:MAG TPA: AMP-binding protein, partial [Pyrinomonadaceae bacterium]|nr:AMP-binding protein [Pyrinomonadaceae bacterium]